MRGSSGPGASRRRIDRRFRRRRRAALLGGAGARTGTCGRARGASQPGARGARPGASFIAASPSGLERTRALEKSGRSARCRRRTHPVLEVELVWPLFSTGIASSIPSPSPAPGTPTGLRTARRPQAVTDGSAPRRAPSRRPRSQVLAVDQPFDLLGRRIALDPEPLHERPAMVEREDRQLFVVAQAHLASKTGRGRWRGESLRLQGDRGRRAGRRSPRGTGRPRSSRGLE